MNKKKIIIIVISLLLIGVIFYFVFRTKAQQTAIVPDSAVKAPPITGGIPEVNNGYIPESFPLNRGMFGDNIKALQTALNKINKGMANIVEDGYFGPRTYVKLVASVPTEQSALPIQQATLKQILDKANLV